MRRIIARSVSIINLNRPTRTFGFGPTFHGFYQGLAEGLIPAQKSPPLVLGKRYSSSGSGKDKAPPADSPPDSEASTSPPGPDQNSGDGSKKKDKVKSESKEKDSANGKKNKGAKSKGKKKHKTGNEDIVAALAEAISKDDWPNIIRHSTLDPELLDGWHPDEGESDWLAAHRMSEALSDVPDEEWDNIEENGVVSPEKLANVLAKKHMGEVTHLPDAEDEEEIELYRKLAVVIGYHLLVWAAEQGRLKRSAKKKKKKSKGGKPDRPCPGST